MLAISLSAMSYAQPRMLGPVMSSQANGFGFRNIERPLPSNTLAARQRPVALKPHARAAAKMEIGGLITEQPAGTLHENQTWSSAGYHPFLGNIYIDYPQGIISRYVEGDDGNLYIENPMSAIISHTWLKLVKQDDGTYLAGPQFVYSESYEDTTYLFSAERLVLNDAHTNYVRDTTAGAQHGVKFTLKDGVLQQVTNNSDILGLVYEDGTWTCYGDFDIKIAPVTDEMVTLPESVKANAVDYEVTFTNSDTTTDKTQTKVAIDGNKIYVKNLAYPTVDEWFVGDIDGTKVTFRSGQYMGPNDSTSTHNYFYAGRHTRVYDSQNHRYDISVSGADETVLNWDAAARTLTADYADSTAMLINHGKDRFYHAVAYCDPQFKVLQAEPKRPANPAFTKVDFTHEASSALNCVFIDIPKEDVDGNYLDPAKMAYKLYLIKPGETEASDFVFTPSEYFGLSEDMVEVPYNYISWMYDIAYSGTVHAIYFYRDLKDYIMGVQVFYAPDENTKLASDTIWTARIPNEVLGVERVNGAATVKAVRYFDMSGRSLSAAPSGSGIYIRQETLSDGTRRTVKAVKR